MVSTPTLPHATDLGAAQIVPLRDVVLQEGIVRSIDFSLSDMYGRIGPQRSVYVDNTSNDAVILITAKTSQQVIKIPPRSFGWYPLMLPEPVQFALAYVAERTSINSLTVQLAFCNVLIATTPAGLFAPGSEPVPALSGAVINATAQGNNTIVAAAAGEITRVYRMYFTVSAPTEIVIQRGATALTGPMFIWSGMFLDFSEKPWYVTGENEALVIYSSNPVTIAGRIEYIRGA